MKGSGDVDPLNGFGSPEPLASARPEPEKTRAVGDAKAGELVDFVETPIVKNSSGAWVEAPSRIGELSHHVGGAPFVRFLDASGKKTRPLWVRYSTQIRIAAAGGAARHARDETPPTEAARDGALDLRQTSTT